ncbi:oligosaccharide flippase family protein [Streptococcus suis]
MQNNFNNKIMNATKWSVVAEITAKIAGPVINIILARLLTPSEFGVVASITIITSLADIFTDAGFQKFVVQHEFDNDDILNKYSDVAFTSNAVLSVIIYCIIFGYRRGLASAIGCPEAYNGLSIAALAVLCTSFSSISIARFRRELNFKPLFYIRFGSSLISLFVTVPLAFVLRSYWAIVIGTVFQQFFIAVLSVGLSKYKPKVIMNIKMFSDMVSFSLWNLMETLSIWFAGQANIFIVASALNPYYLGLYKTGMSTINSYMSIITAAVTPVLFTALSRQQNDRATYIGTFNKFQKMIAILVFPMGVGIFLYRDLAVQLLLGLQWIEVSDFMGLWAVMSALTITFSNMASEVYRSMGRPKISFLLQMVYLVIYVPVIYISAHNNFAILCFASCIVRIVPIFLDFITLNMKFGISFRNIIKNTYIQFVAVALMTIVVFSCQRILGGIVWQIISILICAVFYFAVLLLSPSMRKEISSIKNMI